ncbi:MAG: PHP domain-containing protein [Lentisphaeria bacterium]
MIDLHTHSTASDGTLSPAKLLAKAEEVGLSAIALTDHDTVSGLPMFLKTAADSSVEAIPGVEIAASWYGGSLHIVGLFIDYENSKLGTMLTTIRHNRDLRNRKIFKKLHDLGVGITEEELEAAAGDHVVGRPHFAAALTTKGICETSRQAFGRYLGREGAAYVPRYLPMPAETIKAIHGAGGLAIWAHPAGGPQAAQPAKIRKPARHLKKLGLDGIEMLYPDHSESDCKTIRKIGEELDLAFSGGSDFHGDNMPGIELGTGRGNLLVPDEFLQTLTRISY